MSLPSSKSFVRKAGFAALGAVFIAAAGFDAAEARGFSSGGGGGYSAPRMSAPSTAPRAPQAQQARPAQNPSTDISNPTHPFNPLNPLNPISPLSPFNPIYHTTPEQGGGDAPQAPEQKRPVESEAAQQPRDKKSSNVGAVLIFGGMLVAVFGLARNNKPSAPPLTPTYPPIARNSGRVKRENSGYGPDF